MSWRPSCQLAALRLRADILAATRCFFAERSVLEVETPLLSYSTATDLHLASVSAQVDLPHQQGSKQMFLQTSPEFAMKRLLAAGSGAIYQTTKSFRNGESGIRHNPEFTMLEWYRPGFSLSELMSEVADYLSVVAKLDKPDVITYQQAFLQYLNIDPHRADEQTLFQLAKQKTGISGDGLSRDDCLDLLLTHCIESKLGCEKPVFMIEYPASQASLANIKEIDGIKLAQRFELYANGLELANGYDELIDADEQLHRFKADNKARKLDGLPEIPIDHHLIEALKSGLIKCSGVALGMDRLQMVIQKTSSIDDVIAFPVGRA
ncbi:EF-P lysine aminoacylase EpmA [Alkalimarinus alittae]|uniref:EF-P lysine aminoacylase EpmA n=1 Tax=Alkalimarinus alittae TaxID=2961619 RepID=A0ABY6N4D4_9ALTE|nr:EF-P lysine aminoacylase EpmA [Alkalimarinus alittae]UZE96981.1 EF-P lysine aminoacylase EpmA [Alkalimarinus alittae]